jgi:DDE domain
MASSMPDQLFTNGSLLFRRGRSVLSIEGSVANFLSSLECGIVGAQLIVCWVVVVQGEVNGWQFTAEVILWAVRWYLMFPISYRDLELMLLDRGVTVDHTIFRWIQAYAVELEKRIRRHLRMSNGSWRVDETYIKVKGCWTYLYWAVGFWTARRTLARFEAMAMIRKGQIRHIGANDIQAQSTFIAGLFQIAA